MRLFVSDNVTGACPAVVEAVVSANAGIAASYGEDYWTTALKAKFSELFELEVEVFPVLSGTASNALALAALTPVYGKVYCHELSHINTDECGAPELLTGGAKLIPMRGADGRIAPDDLAQAIRGRGNVHVPQPAVVSITQACETGTVYRPSEILEIAAIARDHHLKVHMDGARFANALSTLGVTPAQMTWQAGVDVLSFGGTKNGCFVAEAVIFFKPEMAENFDFLRKRSGQLISKMRFVSSQLLAYISDDLWLHNAMVANKMAQKLSRGMAALPGIELAYPTESNEVFVRMPDYLISGLRAKHRYINEDELDGRAVRFVTSWVTTDEEVQSLLNDISQCILIGNLEMQSRTALSS
ncbi:MAG: low specificity L-threonine aldolase [Mesorhizobium sp.]|uniref:threonine aldolase family protein n=1 Tax=Mesorhizobium sp. TaxID=1871066 RepID=UPI00120ACD91|nr:low specificity L-threonine aldolase [Mesorhizobium sp.]TIM28845.1 MAG: low specificity L-threonine aldolase [Mesorhizobium sp.]TIO21283.1 MAG: low specificity L-threonine aldolase [Mesorhizobium sp.]